MGHAFIPLTPEENINRVHRGTLTAMGVVEAQSYSTHAFRRGASMELRRCDSTLAQVLKTLGWNSSTFLAYLSFVEDEEVSIRLILTNRQD